MVPTINRVSDLDMGQYIGDQKNTKAFGKATSDSPGGEIKTGGRLKSHRNYFMGSMYDQMLDNVQKKVVEMPIPVNQQIPLVQKEESLYPP